MRKVLPREIDEFLYGSGPYAGVGAYASTCPEIAQAILEMTNGLEQAWRVWFRPTLGQICAISLRAIELAEREVDLTCGDDDENTIFWRNKSISF